MLDGVRIETLYAPLIQQLYEKIAKGKEEAVRANKRFLILIGESHYYLGSYYAELVTILLSAKHLSIKKLLLELNDDKFKNIRKLKQDPTSENSKFNFANIVNLYHFIKKNLPMLFIPIDTGSSKDTEWNSSCEGARQRNRLMYKAAKNKSNSDAVAVVGYMHLYGLLNETNLNKHFHILTINAAKHITDTQADLYSRRCLFFAQSEHVFQFQPEDMTSLKVHEIQAQAIQDVNAQLLLTSEVSQLDLVPSSYKPVETKESQERPNSTLFKFSFTPKQNSAPTVDSQQQHFSQIRPDL